MGIKVEWDNEAHTILTYIFDRVWTWEDFFSAVREARTLIDAAPGNVGIIFQSTSRYPLPAQNLLTNFRKELWNKHPKSKIMVVVTDNLFFRTVMDSVFKIAGLRIPFRIMSDLDEARALIHEHLRELEQAVTPQA